MIHPFHKLDAEGSSPSPATNMKIYPKNTRYLISETGEVFDTKRNKFMSHYDNGLGYKAVKLMCEDGKRRQFYVHRIVAETYLGNIDCFDINHIDGNKSNNSKINLEIISHKENIQHAFDNKLLKGFVEKYYK